MMKPQINLASKENSSLHTRHETVIKNQLGMTRWYLWESESAGCYLMYRFGDTKVSRYFPA